MAQFTLRIIIDNDAYQEARGTALAQDLRRIAVDVENGKTSGKYRDINGNAVG